jgi:hypothetical protein
VNPGLQDDRHSLVIPLSGNHQLHNLSLGPGSPKWPIQYDESCPFGQGPKPGRIASRGIFTKRAEKEAKKGELHKTEGRLDFYSPKGIKLLVPLLFFLQPAFR